jgi:hypothetical protein
MSVGRFTSRVSSYSRPTASGFAGAADPEAWEAREFVANMIVPSILTTLVLLGVHHRTQRSARQRAKSAA